MRKEGLIRNGTKVELLSRSIQVGIDALDQLPALIRQIIEEQMWREHWHKETGRVSYFDSFQEFIATGASRQAGLRKLRQAAEMSPQVEELRQAVLAGEKGINKALIEAGFRSERMTVTKDPEKAAEALARNFNRMEISN